MLLDIFKVGKGQTTIGKLTGQRQNFTCVDRISRNLEKRMEMKKHNCHYDQAWPISIMKGKTMKPNKMDGKN